MVMALVVPPMNQRHSGMGALPANVRQMAMLLPRWRSLSQLSVLLGDDGKTAVTSHCALCQLAADALREVRIGLEQH